MADLWFRKLGFSRNPFAIKPAAFSYELFGPDIGEVISGIDSGKFMFVEAPLGHGKTTLLKSIISRFGGKRKVIYAHAVPSRDVGVKELLKRSSLASFITGNLPSGMILVVDEAQNLLEDSSFQIMEFYKSGNIRAVVFFGTKYPDNGFTGELSAMMNGNTIRLSRPTPEQAVSLVRSRIGNLPLISNEVILMAYRKAQGNPRRLLQVCEDMCRSAIEEGRLSVPPSKILDVSPFPAVEDAASAKTIRVARKKPKSSSRRSPTRASTSRARLDCAQSQIGMRQIAHSAMGGIALKSDLRHASLQQPTAPAVFHKPAEVAPVAYVSSTSEPALGIAAETRTIQAAARSASKPAQRRKRNSSRAAAAKKPSAKPRKKSRLPKPIAKAAVAAVDVSDSSNESGHYWGEFMGMQK